MLRSPNRWVWGGPLLRQSNTGFRTARTLSFNAFDRYAAARAAALAAGGQNKKKPPQGEAAKAKFRRQALGWLNAELTNWSRVQPPRVFIVRNLWHWQEDRALAGIRDQAALAKLPPEEQKVFTQVWADVAKATEPANSAERLDFARVAVLLASGQGKDEPPLGDAAKAKLRGKAFDWLKAELTAAPDRAVKARIIAAAAPLPGLLEKLVESAPKDGPFQAELARHYSEQGKNPLANAARTRALALLEKQLAREPENAALAGELADLLLLDTTRWTIVKPNEMKSQGGATLTLLDDNSILASGNHPDSDAYTLTFRALPGRVHSLRLEALTHDTLPNKGPGRHTHPAFAFVLTTIKAELDQPKGPPLTSKFTNAWADYEPPDSRAMFAIDAADATGWSAPVGESHYAVFELEKSVPVAQGAVLRVTLEFKHANPRRELGRFRLSVSPDLVAVPQQNYLAALKLTVTLTDPWLKLAAAYALDGRNDEALPYFSRALKRADSYEAKKSIIKLAAHFDGVLSALSIRQPDDPLLQLALARKLAQRGMQCLAEKQPAKAQAALEKARAIFTRLLAKYPMPHWTVLKPAQMISKGGATLSLLEDGSILASGTNPDRDEYTLVARPSLVQITAIRLEALPDPSLPHHGPGRGFDGNFHLNKVRVFSAGRPCPLTNILVEHPNMVGSTPSPYQQVISGEVDYSPGWGNWPRAGKSNTATIATRVTRALDHDLKIDMVFSRWSFIGLNLGRFRLAVTNDADAINVIEFRKDLTDGEVADLIVALAKAHVQQGQTNEAAASFMEGIHLATDRAGKLKILAEAAALKGMLQELAKRAAKDGLFQAELARYYAERGNKQLADAAFTKARALLETQLTKEPENTALAAELAQLLLDNLGPTVPDWAVLKPAKTKTESGAKLTLKDDGSILVEAAKSTEQQSVRWQAGPKLVRAVRIETSTHALAPKNGAAFFNEYRMFAATTGVLPGRFVRLDLPGDNNQFPRWPSDGNKKSINLAELQVFHGDQNIALRKKARQSSTWGGQSRLAPEGAVDGNTVGNDQGNPFAHTAEENDPWWEVDLGSEQPIDRIVIWNRTEPGPYAALSTRMNHFRIRVLDRSRKVVFEQVIDKAPNPSTEIVPQALLAETKSGENQPLIVRLPRSSSKDAPLRYRVSVATRLADLGLEEQRLEALKLSDPWLKLATAYQSAGRTREAVPHLAKASAGNPKDTILSMKVAALQAWFGQDRELAATRRRILEFARGTNDAGTAEQAAKSCSILPSTDKPELKAALGLARTAVKVDKGSEWWDWRLLALGMAEYRSGNVAAAAEALRAAAKAGPNNPYVTGISAFYRAMILIRQGKPDEARKLASEAAAKMKPLPADEQNPLAGDAYDDLILWLAYKEAKAKN
jgi:tetratricopeptide (TPR) repeat protein